MDTIDLLFPVLGTHVPVDHGYTLYSAISHLLTCLHDGSVPFGFAPITGVHVGGGRLHLDPARSRLRLRLAVGNLPRVLPLAGQRFQIKGDRIRLGIPQVLPLRPAPSLRARMVAIKRSRTKQPPPPDLFLDMARRQLHELGIQGNPRVPEHVNKEGRREPIRRVLRVKGVRIVGYALVVEKLAPDDSMKLQEKGLGGRRRLGCGLFVPTREEG
jgi:CRISPR-associated endonuclease/helicase Cas3